ncbi:LysR substrate-binding domain-containing protein [Nocardia sp. CA-084685]|uniref:LysR substrate-binding domain-containing protein n=1 Tax=Nocardia sp. CA-084685 TaxID=3239970 RepID=UPI003D9943D8
MPQLISQFRRRAGHVRVTLYQGESKAVAARVLDGTAELAIVSQGPPVTGLCWRRLSRHRYALATPVNHRSAGRRRIRLRDVADAEFIAPPSGFDARRVFDELCSAAGIQVRVTYEAAELDTVTALVAEGLGLAVVPMPEAVPGGAFPRGVGGRVPARKNSTYNPQSSRVGLRARAAAPSSSWRGAFGRPRIDTATCRSPAPLRPVRSARYAP